MKGLDVGARDGKYCTIVHFAAIGRSIEIVRHVCRSQMKAGDGFMQIAAKYFAFTEFLSFGAHRLDYESAGQVRADLDARRGRGK
jgi:hypothetical protein